MTSFMKQLLAATLSILLLIGTFHWNGLNRGQQGYSGQGVPLTADELQQLGGPHRSLSLTRW